MNRRDEERMAEARERLIAKITMAKYTGGDPLLDEFEAAIAVNQSVHTLRRWRTEKQALPYVKLQGKVSYRLSTLHEAVDRATVAPEEVDRGNL